MAVPIQTDRVTRALKQAYGLVGRWRGQIDETVVPVCVVDNLAQQGQQSFQTIRRASAASIVLGVAGEVALFQLQVPPGVLAVVRQLVPITASSIGNQFQVNFGTVVLVPAANVNQKTFVDSRLQASGQTPACDLLSESRVASIANVQYQGIIPSNAGGGTMATEVEWPIGSLRATTFLNIETSLVNASTRLSIVWDEYLITAGSL